MRGSSGALYSEGGNWGSSRGWPSFPTRNLAAVRGDGLAGLVPWGEGTGVTILTGTRAGGAFSGELPSGRARCPAPPLAFSGQRGPPSFLPPCLSSPSVFKLYGFRHRAGRSSQPGLHSLVFGSVPGTAKVGSWRRFLHVERRGDPATSPASVPPCLKRWSGLRRPH